MAEKEEEGIAIDPIELEQEVENQLNNEEG